GLMGAVADAVLDKGGEVIGVMPQGLVGFEVAHKKLGDLRIVGSMHERKALMAELSDAFIALPGGIGTLEETFEMLTWAQLGFQSKPVALLDIGGFFEKLSGFLDHVVDEGFLRPEHRGMLLRETDPKALLDRIAAYQAPALVKWMNRDQT
ncbi:MAG: TIGR00730 family Rossman fold protein, partial [Alphaproteobacteria bacterium]